MASFSIEDLMKIAAGNADVLRRISSDYQARVQDEADLVRQFTSTPQPTTSPTPPSQVESVVDDLIKRLEGRGA